MDEVWLAPRIDFRNNFRVRMGRDDSVGHDSVITEAGRERWCFIVLFFLLLSMFENFHRAKESKHDTTEPSQSQQPQE